MVHLIHPTFYYGNIGSESHLISEEEEWEKESIYEWWYSEYDWETWCLKQDLEKKEYVLKELEDKVKYAN